MTNIPRGGPVPLDDLDVPPRRPSPADVREAGRTLITSRGWAVFLQRTGSDGVRRALPMCPGCRAAPHPPASCPHTWCHGFYAATRDLTEWDRMCDAFPDADVLCVRTGRRSSGGSGLLVIDFDSKHDGPETHDRWGEVAGVGWSFPATLRQRTRSGGFHLLYELPDDEAPVRSRNAVTVRGVDVKADGGLVVVPPSAGYAWLVGGELPAELRRPSAEVLGWARDAPVWRPPGAGRRTPGTRALRALGEVRSRDWSTRLHGALGAVIPAGERDEAVNALCFALRKSGMSWEDAVESLRDVWEHGTEHPEGDEFRWEWCEYKLRRVWSQVEPDPPPEAGLRWVAATRAADGDGTLRLGRKTIAPRHGRNA